MTYITIYLLELTKSALIETTWEKRLDLLGYDRRLKSFYEYFLVKLFRSLAIKSGRI